MEVQTSNSRAVKPVTIWRTSFARRAAIHLRKGLFQGGCVWFLVSRRRCS